MIDGLMKKGVRDFSVAEKLAGVLEMLHEATSGGVASSSPLRNNDLTQFLTLNS
ncbi:MAG: hypothetical protein LBS03_01730 [Bacteroidales bacterium]|nr:hypothetical protein [Bacteroidales bacterium]